MSSSIRSRAVSLPLACCAAIRASPPPRRARARRRSRRASMSFMEGSAGDGDGVTPAVLAWRGRGRNGASERRSDEQGQRSPLSLLRYIVHDEQSRQELAQKVEIPNI